jgi:pimeloyl-ACP methyl ester carboxylesterase
VAGFTRIGLGTTRPGGCTARPFDDPLGGSASDSRHRLTRRAGHGGTLAGMGAEPSRIVTAPDGTQVAVFSHGEGSPMVLVHGAAADHTTFRVVGPLLAERHAVHEIDRRGRGASGDTQPYAIDREYEDLAAVADALAAESGTAVAVVGHSFGGRVGLGAAPLTSSIGRLVVYEGAPPTPDEPYQDPALLDRLRTHRDAGDWEQLLITFLRDVVRMPPADLAAYQSDPVWPLRVAAAHTIVREVQAETTPAASLDALGELRTPVLQILGGDSAPSFQAATRALEARLKHAEVSVIAGARHAAHHTHPGEFVRVVERFLEGVP